MRLSQISVSHQLAQRISTHIYTTGIILWRSGEPTPPSWYHSLHSFGFLNAAMHEWNQMFIQYLSSACMFTIPGVASVQHWSSLSWSVSGQASISVCWSAMSPGQMLWQEIPANTSCCCYIPACKKMEELDSLWSCNHYDWWCQTEKHCHAHNFYHT